MSERLKKILELLEDEDLIPEKDSDDIYPISKYEAYQIANKENNLKNDFCKELNKYYTGIWFNDYKIKLVKIKNRKYWFIKIIDADISWNDNGVLCDGFATKKDLEKLKCYIDVITGQYIYYKIMH